MNEAKSENKRTGRSRTTYATLVCWRAQDGGDIVQYSTGCFKIGNTRVNHLFDVDQSR